jgi:hypothetical protein
MVDDKQKPQPQRLSALLAAFGGITFGLLGAFFIGPSFFPRVPGEGFAVSLADLLDGE